MAKFFLGASSTTDTVTIPVIQMADWAKAGYSEKVQNGTLTKERTWASKVENRRDVQLIIRQVIPASGQMSQSVVLKTRAVETDVDGNVITDKPVTFALNMNFHQSENMWDPTTCLQAIYTLVTAATKFTADVAGPEVIQDWGLGSTEI